MCIVKELFFITAEFKVVSKTKRQKSQHPTCWLRTRKSVILISKNSLSRVLST